MVQLGWTLALLRVFRDAATGDVFHRFMTVRKWGFLPGFAMLMMYAYFMGTARSKVLMVSMISGGLGQHRGRRLAD